MYKLTKTRTYKFNHFTPNSLGLSYDIILLQTLLPCADSKEEIRLRRNMFGPSHVLYIITRMCVCVNAIAIALNYFFENEKASLKSNSGAKLY